MEQLFIPKTIKVGFNYRADTYNKKLAFVVYYDSKGKLRKEKSWTGWIEHPGNEPKEWQSRNKGIILDESFAPVDLDNVPMEGFVLNKNVGGQRQSWGCNVRNEYIRCYDPRGFEFEMTLPNLLFILQECTSTQGKGLEGNFIYSWDGKDLVLLPCNSNEYKTSMEFTNIQSNKITKKDMKEGSIYVDKNQNRLIYLGRFDYREINYDSSEIKKKHIFYGIETKKFFHHIGFTKLAVRETETCVDNYAELVDEFLKSKHGSFAVSFFTKPATLNTEGEDLHRNIRKDYNTNIYLKENDKYYDVKIENVYEGYYSNNHKVIGYKLEKTFVLNEKEFKDINKKYLKRHLYNKVIFSKEQILAMDFINLYVKLDSGSKMLIDEYLNND